MIIYAYQDGRVKSYPALIPQGSGYVPVQVIAPDFTGWTCSVSVFPPSKMELDPMILTPAFEQDGVWDGSLPPGTAVKPGQGLYQIQFTDSGGKSQATITGSFSVQRGIVDAYPDDLSDLSGYTIKTLSVLLSQLVNKYQEIEYRLDDAGSDLISRENLKNELVNLGGYEMKLSNKVLTWGISGTVLASVLLNFLSGCLWTKTEREQLATVLEHNAYADTEAQVTANELIESLRGGGSVEPEPEYVTISFDMPNAQAVINGSVYATGSTYVTEKGTESIQVTVRPVSSDNSAWPSDGAVITVGGAVPSDGQEVTLDGLSCYRFSVVPSADTTVSCTLADLTPEEPWVAVSLSVSCALPLSPSGTGAYLLYTGTGRRYGTVDSLRDVLTVTCRYERTDDAKSETVELYTLSSSIFGTGTITEMEGTDTLTISFGDLTARVYLILVAEDECQGMTVAYNAASVHVGDNVSNIFSTIGLTVSMKYQGEVAITTANWSVYVGIYSYSYLTAGDRPVESGQDRFAVIPAGTNEPGSDTAKYRDILVNGCYTVTVEANGCTADKSGGLYLGGGTHVFIFTPNTGYELVDGDVVIGGAGTYTINEDGTATVTLETLVNDISIVVNASEQVQEITVSVESGKIVTNATTATVSGGKIILS